MKIFDIIKNKTGLSNVKVKNVRSKVFSLTAIVGLSVLSLSYQNCAKKMSTKLAGSSTQASTVVDGVNTDQNGGGDISNNTNNYNSGGGFTNSGVNNTGTSGSTSGSSGGITAGASGNTSSNVVLPAGACLFQNKSVTNSATVVGYTQDQAADGGCSQYEVHYRCNNGTLEKINPTYYGTNTSGATYVGSPNNLKLSCKQSASMSCTGWRNADGTYELNGKFIPASADKGKEGYYFIAAVHQGSVYAIRLDLAGFFSVPNINAMPGFASPTQINFFHTTLISSANVNNYFHNATWDKVPRSIDEIAVRTTEANLFSKENTVSKGRIGFTSDPAINVETKVHMKTSAELSSFAGAEFYMGYSIGAKSDDSILEPKLQKKILCAIVQ
jgi:hypothetical protein